MCFPSLHGGSRPARSNEMPARRKKTKDAEYLRVVWPLAVSCGSRKNQDAGIRVFVSGTLLGKYRRQPQDGPISLTLSTLGAGGKAGEPTAQSLLAPGGRGLPAVSPGVPSLPDPTPGPPRPCPCAQLGGGRQWQLQHTASWAGIFFLFLPTFPHLNAAPLPALLRVEPGL